MVFFFEVVEKNVKCYISGVKFDDKLIKRSWQCRWKKRKRLLRASQTQLHNLLQNDVNYAVMKNKNALFHIAVNKKYITPFCSKFCSWVGDALTLSHIL